MKFATRAVHAGQTPDSTGAVTPPIYLSSTFVQPGAGEWGEFDYSRSGNPTRLRFETALAELEGAARGLAFASGMAATTGAMLLLAPGDHVVASRDLYGGTHRLLFRVLQPRGVEVSLAATDAPDALRAALRPNTKLVWVETPGNPLLSVTDLAAAAELAHGAGALLAVDNTLASPAITRPIEFGADIVMHSATKFIAGHSDVLGGALLAATKDLGGKLYFLQNATGGVMGPLESYLAGRGLRTLPLRTRHQSATALDLARRLTAAPWVRRVFYPGLEDHPQHALARRQMTDGFGCVVSFELATGDSRRFVKATELFQLAVSLGAVESLISLPALMSHASYAPADRAALGVTPDLIRLSVGVEDADDLWDDLLRAEQAANG